MSKLQDWKTNLTRKQRVILLIVVAVVVLALLTATVFRDNVVSFFAGQPTLSRTTVFPTTPNPTAFLWGWRTTC